MADMRVGIVGCGNIGGEVCAFVQRGGVPAEITALTDIDEDRAHQLLAKFELNARVCTLEENAALVDYLVECAAASVVPAVVDAAIRCRRDCLIMSVGGLLANPDLLAKAREGKVLVQVPSGALCGLDGVRAAKEAGLNRVTLTTRKPPKGLEGAPYLVENRIDVMGLTEERVVFEGTAQEAVKAFPKNVNVAAALSLVGLGPEHTHVRVIADPKATQNCHEVVAEGDFGLLRAVTENEPSPRNPKSSYLAALSACAELRVAAAAFAARR